MKWEFCMGYNYFSGRNAVTLTRKKNFIKEILIYEKSVYLSYQIRTRRK